MRVWDGLDAGEIDARKDRDKSSSSARLIAPSKRKKEKMRQVEIGRRVCSIEKRADLFCKCLREKKKEKKKKA